MVQKYWILISGGKSAEPCSYIIKKKKKPSIIGKITGMNNSLLKEKY